MVPPTPPSNSSFKDQKVRVPYHCAAKFEQTLLNQQVPQGPDQTNHLVGVLSRLRQEVVGVVADIAQIRQIG